MNGELSLGRSIKLGRIEGNFLLICKHDTVRMEDKHSVEAMLKAHKRIENFLKSVSILIIASHSNELNVRYKATYSSE